MAESEELKRLLRKVKEKNEKADLKLNIKKTKIMASGSIPSWKIEWETKETDTFFFFFLAGGTGGLKNHCRCCVQPWN